MCKIVLNDDNWYHGTEQICKKCTNIRAKQKLRHYRDYYLKAWAKRKGKGFIPLNEYFDDADGHHIDQEQVIFIPMSIHRCIPHHHNDVESMWTINAIALMWLFYGEIQEVKMKIPRWVFGDSFESPKKYPKKIQKKLF
ncbi:MAG: hypothetical protein V1854_02785 [Methanobacteriota archaeon]